MSYLNWDTKVVADFSDRNVSALFDAGYLFTRVDKGVMNKTRSVRVRLADFDMSSENRRIERKTESLELDIRPIPYPDYSWKVGKLAKDFYEARDAVFTANKIKELITDKDKSSFNRLFAYRKDGKDAGYAIVFENGRLLHYCFPFYDPNTTESNLGMGMMLRAVAYAKESGKEYIYLGALQRPSDTYKLQFKGCEWFDGERWRTDLEPLKELLK